MPPTKEQFFQVEGTPEVFTGIQGQEGLVAKGKGFKTEEEFLGVGGLKTQNRQEGDPFFSNVISISSDQLLTPQPIDITTGAPKQEVGLAAEAVAGVNEAANQAKIVADQQAAEAKAQQTAARGDITGIFEELEGEGAAQLAGEQEAGIPAFQQQQADIQGQIAVKNAEYNQMVQDEEAELTRLEGRTGTSRTQFLEDAAQLAREFRSRKNGVAADLTLLQAQSLAVSGRQSAAQASVDRAVDLKYDGLRAERDTKLFMLDSIRGDLTAAEAKQADALRRQLTRKDKAEQEQKDKEKAVNKIAIDAAANNAPQAIIDEIKALAESGDVVGATQLAAPFLAEEEELQTQIVEIAGRKLLVDTQTGATIRDLGSAIRPIVPGAPGEEVVDIKPAQRLAAGFASRIEQSSEVIGRLSEQFTGFGARIPIFESLKSEDRKLLEQAERNFVNAVLRRESGAAISPEEFVSAEKQYFAQRGDGEAVLKQKEENRNTVLQSMKLEAGAAFGELEGVLPDATNQGVTLNGVNYQVGEIIENEKGQRGRVEADGTITIIE